MKVILVLACIISLIYCQSLYQTYQFNDVAWSVIDKVPLNKELQVRIALRQQNLVEFKQIAQNIANPDHPDYTAYMSRDEIRDFLAPSIKDQYSVIGWLKQHGVRDIQNFGDYVQFQATVSLINTLFQTELKFVRYNADSSSPVYMKFHPEYYIPEHLTHVIEFVQDFPFYIHRRPVRSMADVPSPDVVIPSTVAELYYINRKVTTNSSVNVWEFTTTSYKDSDFQQFIEGTGVQTPNKITQIGDNNDRFGAAECTLDIQYITSIAQNSTNFYTTSTEWVLEAAQTIFNYPVPILVNSISWSADEASEGYAYNSRADTEFSKLGARGITVLAASGDSGADCNFFQNGFQTGYPATSPNVVSVGATMIVESTSSEKDASEALPSVCSDNRFTCAVCTNGACTEEPADPAGTYASGGGVSVYETRPEYQQSVVSAYLSSGVTLPPSSFYNASNRFFPDVAANGDNLLIYLNGKWLQIGGTSASTPIWGGMIALINDYLIGAGKNPVGSVNPLLYKMASEQSNTFLPIGTVTTNNDDNCKYGWESNPNGYDPVTGLGTANFQNIMSYVQNNLDLFKDYNIR
jgi:tripeptidyl-peptidase-1